MEKDQGNTRVKEAGSEGERLKWNGRKWNVMCPQDTNRRKERSSWTNVNEWILSFSLSSISYPLSLTLPFSLPSYQTILTRQFCMEANIHIQWAQMKWHNLNITSRIVVVVWKWKDWNGSHNVSFSLSPNFLLSCHMKEWKTIIATIFVSFHSMMIKRSMTFFQPPKHLLEDLRISSRIWEDSGVEKEESLNFLDIDSSPSYFWSDVERENL